ncbi:trifunctional serine/threonine-protein kinase/ATP-binding protein/sensor histidine kinase [Rhizobium oryzicola]|uniref:histidine kinase n=1 Tax=Rhizobium oryzicola TaxID=1232668 RepID=A0ABT8T268_9HYPH|nr:ATP-binding sensor histidine kinase [Rhizobium oryzicola]MDO1584849.1 AAA family ATPase [Rhizobium oryzicola]
MTESHVIFDDAWLVASQRELVWQSGGRQLYRLYDPSGTWEAFVLPSGTEASVGCEVPTWRNGCEWWHDRPKAVLLETDRLVAIFETSSILTNLLRTEPRPLDEFLPLAISMTKAVVAAHADCGTLASLHPSNIAIDKNREARLRNFGTIDQSGALSPSSSLHVDLGDDIVYRAPEQLRPISPQSDARSDLYALGMVLFKLLTGSLPLSASSTLEWRHAHFALAPQNASVVYDGLPAVIAAILDRLLAKEPTVRYQSAIALEMDLLRCLQEWRQNRAISDFEIGVIDAPFAQLSIPALSGRANEQHLLGEAVQVFLRDRKPGLIGVHGQPGVGKSALIQNLTSGLPEHIFFIQGKGDLQQSDSPYAPIVQAMRALIDHVMRFDRLALSELRQLLAGKLEGNARLLLDLVPAMEVLTGTKTPAGEIPAPLMQLLLQRALRSVLSTVADALSPVVLFIDDLQWADEATLSLLSFLVQEPIAGLLLVVASRSDENSTPKALASLAVSARATMVDVTEIVLAPLSLDAIGEMLLAIFPEASRDLLGLADTLQEKTGGNPFYVRRLLQALVQDGVIAFSPVERSWSCRKEDVSRYPVSENILSFVTQRLMQAGPEALNILITMACIGPQTDKAVLAHALNMSDDQLLDQAMPLVRSGFIILSPTSLKFAHDRIQEAAYALLDVSKRQRVHHSLAHVLLSLWGTQSGPAAFAIASQIELSHAECLSRDERKLFVEALLAAVTHARRSAAAVQATRYAEAALRLIDEEMWKEEYALSFRAHILLCDALLAAAILDKADTQLHQLLPRAASDLDRNAVFRLRANLLTLQSDYEGAIDAVLSGLTELGVHLKRWPCREEQDQIYGGILELLGDQPVAALADSPAMEDPRVRAAMSLLAPLISSVFTTDGLRFTHLAKMVELTIRYGACPESSHGLSWFGAMIGEKYDAYHDGLEFCLAARALVDRYGFEEYRTSVLLAVDQIGPWTRPMPFALERVREAITAGHAAGDVAWMCYARNHLISDLIFMGEDLTHVAREAEESVAVCRRFGYSDIEYILTAQLSFVHQLADGGEASRIQALDTGPRAPIVAPTTLFWVNFYAGMSLYFVGTYEEAIAKLAYADELGPLLITHIDTAYCKFFLGMAIAASYNGVSGAGPDRQRLSEIKDRFASWAKLNPETFGHKLLLLEAEIARIEMNPAHALVLYEEAAQAARASHFQQEVALAMERAALCCLNMGNAVAGNAYMRVAAATYARWGAGWKADILTANLLPDVLEPPATKPNLRTHSAEAETVLGISLALSDEIMLDRLIETLMKRMLVHTGANRGLLLKISEGRLDIEASAWTDGGNVRVSSSNLPQPDQGLPYSVIDRALQVRAPFLLSGTDFGTWTSERDAVLTGRSLLCVPLLRRGELTGLLCLQNDYLEGVFAPDTIALVTVIASQAAISLENARLYTSLLAENELRAKSERALAGARAELEKTSRLTLLGSIAASITHEIGQPLAAIASNAGAGLRWLKRAEPEIEETVMVLTEIQASVARAHEIIRALRALSKQVPGIRQNIKVDEVIKEVLHIARSEIERHGVDVTVTLAAGEGAVLGDATQLKQVVLNLLQNGMEAMDTLPSAERRMEIVSCTKDGDVTVDIRDFGSGISPEIASQIFEPMYTTKAAGMGMGLAICKSIIEAHDGILKVTALDVGTVFTFTLPISLESEP